MMDKKGFYNMFRTLLEADCSSVEEVFEMGKMMTKALEEAIPHSAIEVYEREGK